LSSYLKGKGGSRDEDDDENENLRIVSVFLSALRGLHPLTEELQSGVYARLK